MFSFDEDTHQTKVKKLIFRRLNYIFARKQTLLRNFNFPGSVGLFTTLYFRDQQPYWFSLTQRILEHFHRVVENLKMCALAWVKSYGHFGGLFKIPYQTMFSLRISEMKAHQKRLSFPD